MAGKLLKIGQIYMGGTVCLHWLKYSAQIYTQFTARHSGDTLIPKLTPRLATGGLTNMSDGIAHVTDDSFDQEVLQAEGPVLVDYWAEWCGPCKMIAPIIDEIADEYGDRLKVTKLDIDSNMQTPQQYSIRGIPTLMIFRDGKVQATKVGAMTKGQLKAFVEEVV